MKGSFVGKDKQTKSSNSRTTCPLKKPEAVFDPKIE